MAKIVLSDWLIFFLFLILLVMKIIMWAKIIIFVISNYKISFKIDRCDADEHY